MVLFPGRGDALQDFFETGLTMAVVRWKIRSADKRLQIRCQPNTHRPAAAAGCRLHKRHVNAIDVRPFLAIDFDVHKFAIHDCSRLFVLERLMRHDMTPMTGRVSH